MGCSPRYAHDMGPKTRWSSGEACCLCACPVVCVPNRQGHAVLAYKNHAPRCLTDLICSLQAIDTLAAWLPPEAESSRLHCLNVVVPSYR